MRSTVQKIFFKTPHQKQVMMFSATMSPEMRVTCKKFLHNAMEIFIDDQSKLTLHGLQQYSIELKEDAKTRKLHELLDAIQFNQVIIFVKSVKRADVLNDLLIKNGFPSVCIHSRLKQEDRYFLYFLILI